MPKEEKEPKLNLKKLFSVMKKEGSEEGEIDISLCINNGTYFLTNGHILVQGSVDCLYQLPIDFPGVKAGGKNFSYSTEEKKFILNEDIAATREDFASNFKSDGYTPVALSTINTGTIMVVDIPNPFCLIFNVNQTILLNAKYIEAIKTNMIASIIAKTEKDVVVIDTLSGEKIFLMPMERHFNIKIEETEKVE